MTVTQRLLTLFGFILVIVFCYMFVDIPVASTLQTNLPHEIRRAAHVFDKIGYALYLLVPLTVIMVVAKFRGNETLFFNCLFIWLAIVISGLTADLLKVVLGRSRPILFFDNQTYGFYFFKLKASYWSFPSGHSATAAAIFTSIWYLFHRQRIALILATLVVSSCRVLTGSHYCSDILAGIALGFITVDLLARYYGKKLRIPRVSR